MTIFDLATHQHEWVQIKFLREECAFEGLYGSYNCTDGKEAYQFEQLSVTTGNKMEPSH